MTHYIEISSLKGGVGKTTVAGLVALALNEQGNKVMLVGVNASDQIHGLMATTADSPSWGNIDISVVGMNGGGVFYSYDDHDYVVVDAGTQMFDYPDGSVVTRIGVVRNDYLSLRAMTTYSPDFFVATHNPTNVLNMKDVRAVLLRPVVEMPVREDIARAIDAGLLNTRWKSLCGDTVREITESLTVSV